MRGGSAETHLRIAPRPRLAEPVNAKFVVNRIKSLIRNAPAGGMFHDATMSDTNGATTNADFVMVVNGKALKVTVTEL